MKHEQATAQLAQELDRARAALTVERLAPLAAAPLLAALAWIGVSLFGFHAAAPPLAASLVSIAVLWGLVALAVRRAQFWRRPSVAEARARLAIDAGLDAHALDALEDHPARLDPMGLALWNRAQARAREAALRASAKPVRLDLNAADPWRLRYVAGAAVVGGLLTAGLEAPDRLARALLPDPGPLLGDGPLEIEAWAAPASYTGAAPVSLSGRVGEQVATPPSVEATVRVTGPVGAPMLVFEGAKGRRAARFVKAADGAYEAKLALPGPGTLKIVRFHTQARWAIRPGADAAPKAAFAAPPKAEGEAVSFRWSAEDDFGVRGLKLRVAPVDPPLGLAGAAPLDIPIEPPAADPRQASAESKLELPDHPYAGLEVEARVVAVDALGQEGQSPPARVKLPEKLFLQPLARAAIEVRKEILFERRPYDPPPRLRPDQVPARLKGFDIVFGTGSDPILTDEFNASLERAPDAIKRAARMIEALTAAPEDGYFQDLAVFAGFAGARAALGAARDPAASVAAADILWKTALRAEYGDAADARRALLEAQRALSEAIRNGADKEALSRLSGAVRQAMQNYLQALVQEAQREGRQNSPSDEDTKANTQISRNDVEEMLREVQRLAEAGQTAAAQALLEKLAAILDNLEIKLAEGQGEGGEPGEQDGELKEQVEGLSDAIGKQRALRDETARGGQEGEGEKKNEESRALAQRQEALRRQLDEAKRNQSPGEQNARDPGQGAGEGASEGEKDLSAAGEAMDEAAKALREGDFAAAEQAQDQALRRLRAGAETLSKEILRREDARNAPGQGQTGERDPLGRQMGAADRTGEEVSVPDAADRQRAREILDELRRRAQDPRRPEAERAYLRRLLERFAGS